MLKTKNSLRVKSVIKWQNHKRLCIFWGNEVFGINMTKQKNIYKKYLQNKLQIKN